MSDTEETEFSIEELEAPANMDSEVLKEAIRVEGTRSKLGLIFAAIAMLLGLVVIILGTTGTVDWSFDGFGVSSRIQTSVVGVVFVVAGVLVIALTKPKIKLTSSSNGNDSDENDSA